MKRMVMVLMAVAAGGAKAESACEDCWTEQCKEFRGTLPKCRAAAGPTPKPVPKGAVKACSKGKVRTQGACCWPAQGYSETKKRCVGEPECPGGMTADGEECVVARVEPEERTEPRGGKREAGATTKDGRSGITWVWMPAGRFPYGCVSGDAQCDSDETKPARDTSVEGFWMAQTETTVEQFEACAAAGECSSELRTQDTDMKTCNWKNRRYTNPMNCLNWAEAEKYCRWAGGRLPTAVEWEYAAKSGAATIYPWGDEKPSGNRANFCDRNCPDALDDAAKKKWKEFGWVSEGVNDGWAGTAPVKLYPGGRLRGACTTWPGTSGSGLRRTTTQATRKRAGGRGPPRQATCARRAAAGTTRRTGMTPSGFDVPSRQWARGRFLFSDFCFSGF